MAFSVQSKVTRNTRFIAFLATLIDWVTNSAYSISANRLQKNEEKFGMMVLPLL